jgi:hypothetical protein
MAGFYRGMSELSSALSGKQRQAALQLAELGLETSILEKKLEVQMESLDNTAMSAIADSQFNMRVLDADIASAVAQSERNMQQISLQKYGADLNAAANLMIKPERAPVSPEPTMAPAPTFVPPPKLKYVPTMGGASSSSGDFWASAIQSIGNIGAGLYGSLAINNNNTAGGIFNNPYTGTIPSYNSGSVASLGGSSISGNYFSSSPSYFNNPSFSIGY